MDHSKIDTFTNKLPRRKRARDDDDHDMKFVKRAKRDILDGDHQFGNDARILESDTPMEISDSVTTLETNQCVAQSGELCHEQMRRKLKIHVEGVDVPAPLKTFREMKLPRVILQGLEDKGIVKPTPIQAQGIPTVLSGRDMIGIAPTGSGKALVFVLPLIMFCSEQGRTMSHMQKGPYGLIICPARELAQKTLKTIRYYTNYIKSSSPDCPELKSCLVIDDVPASETLDIIKQGVDIMVATPPQLKNILDKKIINLNSCRYLCMDETDRMIDMGFEKDLRRILTFFRGLRQTLMFSTTMSESTREFAASAFHQPVTIKYQMTLNIVQRIELMSEDMKVRYLLPCLAKTSPPALIFAEKPTDVKTIFQYLLSKGIEAAAIYDRENNSIEDFRAGKKDVLVTTDDVLLEGLDFPNIQHVINYDMPDNLEVYVRRIEQTGRRPGLATTFIAQAKASVLRDLKDFLVKTQQNVPPLLLQFCS